MRRRGMRSAARSGIFFATSLSDPDHSPHRIALTWARWLGVPSSSTTDLRRELFHAIPFVRREDGKNAAPLTRWFSIAAVPNERRTRRGPGKAVMGQRTNQERTRSANFPSAHVRIEGPPPTEYKMENSNGSFSASPTCSSSSPFSFLVSRRVSAAVCSLRRHRLARPL
ncbi:hypothetical protein PLICRDRAFT_259885 [Plicaturopsis crispa FD-325 SS-3]|nr:hypothetical protein PLICRDRAFT_259885 [Plicaturopsis crispa FD-325 SS-3]